MSSRKRKADGEQLESLSTYTDNIQHLYKIQLRSELVKSKKASEFPTSLIASSQSAYSEGWMIFDNANYFPIGIVDLEGKFVDLKVDITEIITLKPSTSNFNLKPEKYDECTVVGTYSSSVKASRKPVYWFASIKCFVPGLVKLTYSCNDNPEILPLQVFIEVVAKPSTSSSKVPAVAPVKNASQIVTPNPPPSSSSISFPVAQSLAYRPLLLSRLDSQHTIELSSDDSSLSLQLPPILVAALLDDQQHAMRDTPSKERYQPTVKEIVEAAITHQLSLSTDNTTDNIITNTDNKLIPPELGSRLLILFDTLLEHRLLYVEELEYFHSHNLFSQLKSGGIRPSSWFGATHLLRLLVKLAAGSGHSSRTSTGHATNGRNAAAIKALESLSEYQPLLEAIVKFLCEFSFFMF